MSEPQWQKTDSRRNIIKYENDNFVKHLCIGMVLFVILSCLLVPFINGWGFLIGILSFGLPFGSCYLRRPKIGNEYGGYYRYESADDDSDSFIGISIGVLLIGGFVGIFCFLPRLFQFIEGNKENNSIKEEEVFIGKKPEIPEGQSFATGQYVVVKSTGDIFKIHSTIKRDKEYLYYSIKDDKYFTAAEIEDYFEYNNKGK